MTERSLHHPGRWVWLLLVVPVLIGLFRLHLDVEIFNLLPADVPAVRGLIIHQQNFANARELIVTVQAPTAEKAENAARAIADTLRTETNLVASVLWQPPWLEHPEWSAELIAYLWLNAQPRAFTELARRLNPTNLADLAVAAREQLATSLSPGDIARLSYDPFGFTQLPPSVSGAAPSFAQGQEGFSSGDGTFRILFVEAKTDLPTYEDCARWLTQVKDGVTRASGAEPGLAIGYTGRPAFVAEIAHQMRGDITLSIGLTALIIGILFWLAHRRFKPMLWLLTLLALILGSTLALGGLIFGAINVVSMGFAAILLGLAVDYAVVHYQEALAKPELTVPQIRHAIAPSILWAAVTTISAFLALNFGGLPGLAQLGTLVAVGVTLAALIMIFEFLPPLFPGRNRPEPTSSASNFSTTPAAPASNFELRTSNVPQPSPFNLFVPATALLLLFASAVLALKGMPKVDPTAEPLRPRKSTAFAALNRVQRLLTQDKEPLWVIVRGTNELQVAQRLSQIQPALDRAAADKSIDSYTLPTPLWPNPLAQSANRDPALRLLSQRQAFHRAATEAGFTTNALGLTDSILNTWSAMAALPGVAWPTNRMSQWLLDKVAVHSSTNFYALALVTPVPLKKGDPASRQFNSLAGQLNTENSWFTGWELLGSSIFSRVKQNFWKVLVPMALLVLLSLWFAFRRPAEILLSIGVLALSCLSLLAVMRLAGWSWNLLNLMAIPLILGTGVDYSIFMLLGLRRCQGDLHMAYRAVGRALLLCGGTAVAGFGSLSFSSNAGMASLGQVCAVGIAFNMLLGIFILPRWWQALSGGATLNPHPPSNLPPSGTSSNFELRTSNLPTGPSSLYRATLWRLGLLLARTLPRSLCLSLASALADLYWVLARQRRQIVSNNLLPLLEWQNTPHPSVPAPTSNFDARLSAPNSKFLSKRLLRNFAIKLVDLWRFEAGIPVDSLLADATAWQHFQAALDQKRGLLILTPHLGNWEFGAPFLLRKGLKLLVLTLAEPGKNFTQLRQSARAQWQIETLVIGQDPFAFLEVIRRLESGAAVALLVDRPPPASAVTVNLFGRPFSASIAAAELARASNCVLLPVFMPYLDGKYYAHVLPPVDYDRATLRDRQARRELTQRVISAFEPIIARYPDQWYHFVPVWPPSSTFSPAHEP